MTIIAYAVVFRGHIHTDIDKRLTVLRTKREALQWIKDHGGPDCKVVKLEQRT